MTPQELKKELLKYDSRFLVDLIIDAIHRKKDFKNAILEKFIQKINHQGLKMDDIADDSLEKKVKINDALLLGYWKDLRKIVRSANKYGGCDYKDENKAYSLFEKMNNFLEREMLSEKLRQSILKEAMEEHREGNSGFDDDLTSLMEALCFEKNDWELLASYYESFKATYSSHYQELARMIRLEKLEDEEAYLKSLLANLTLGANYYELAQFYLNNNDQTKAIEVMWDGIYKADGSLKELFEYLFDYYKKEMNDEKIEVLCNKVSIRHAQLNYDIYDRLFNYYQDSNYEKAKEALLNKFKYANIWRDELVNLYLEAKEFLSEKDMETEKPQIYKIIFERNKIAYLKVLILEGEHQTALNYLLEGKIQADFYDKDSLTKIALDLKSKFPNEIIAYFWEKVNKIAIAADSNFYHTAAMYLEIVRKIYIEELDDKDTFIKRLTELRNVHFKKPSFLKATAALLK